MAIAGKVAITPGYEWSVDVAYDKLVIVTYNNNVYLSTKANTGIEPTNEEFWMLLIENVTAENLEELQTMVNAILNGTTPVGNAEKLGGKSASEYALGKDYLPLSGGGTVSKNAMVVIGVRRTDGNNPVVMYHGANAAVGGLGFSDAGIPAYLTPDVSKFYPLLHTGNKPTGSYTGNGDATSRTINTGGIGSGLLVYNTVTAGGAIVYAGGCLVFDGSGVSRLPYQECHFLNGVLTVASTNQTVNGSGNKITWDIL